MAIKKIHNDSNKNFRIETQEKSYLISLLNKGNFPFIYDWNFEDEYLYIFGSLMGPYSFLYRKYVQIKIGSITILISQLILFANLEICMILI